MALKIGKTEDHQITISNLDADARIQALWLVAVDLGMCLLHFIA